MGYAAVKGGLDAIRAAEELVRHKRTEPGAPPLAVETVTRRLRLLVDRVQSEGSLWAPRLAARALRQTEGDVIEAAQLVRSYRSTLPTWGATATVDADELRPLRRIVPAYRTPPGPQLLGRTLDYTGRLLDMTEPDVGTVCDPPNPATARTQRGAGSRGETAEGPSEGPMTPTPRLLDLLRKQDLIIDRRRSDDPEPVDITRTPLRTPAPRSARLAALARGETGGMINLWYQQVRGPKSHIHEVTLGEVRHGHLPIRVRNPLTGGTIEIGCVEVTEVEAYEDVRSTDDDRFRFDVGYGLVFGHNERKAIAMSILEVMIERAGDDTLEQSVLHTVDGLDATGFLEHLKLPHYVTFRSQVERKLAVRKAAEKAHGLTRPGITGLADAPMRSRASAVFEEER